MCVNKALHQIRSTPEYQYPKNMATFHTTQLIVCEFGQSSSLEDEEELLLLLLVSLKALRSAGFVECRGSSSETFLDFSQQQRTWCDNPSPGTTFGAFFFFLNIYYIYLVICKNCITLVEVIIKNNSHERLFN